MTTYAVDIDGTLCEENNEWWKYRFAVPIFENIEAINKLYQNGEKIVLYTARFEEDREVTTQWLKTHGVKYHRIIFDKFRADVYVDSAMVKPEDL